MSISSINGDPCRDCPVWRCKIGEFFPVGMRMKEKVLPKEVWRWGHYFIIRPAETPSPKTIKITFKNLYLNIYKLFLIIFSHTFVYI
jgi:hypothetical protein